MLGLFLIIQLKIIYIKFNYKTPVLLKNLINNKSYIGSAINLIKIFTALHSTKCLMYTSNKSHNALLKYGYENYNTIIRLNILFFL